MANLYISYNQRDREFVASIAERLKGQGHQLTLDVEALSPGQDWRRALTDGLKSSEVFIVFLSQNSLDSQFVLSEIGAARAYAAESDRMLMIPVIIDEIQIPAVIQDLHVIVVPNRDIEQIVERISTAISAFIGRRAAKEEQAEAVAQRIEANAAEYIEEAIRSLEKLERRNGVIGSSWYIAGFVSLILGIAFAFVGVANIASAPERTWVDFAILSLKTIVVIGLLGACAKYAFTLGKSYVSESLKSADRIHAISFGKFYLRVFSAKATWPELKEVFQHWNIDRSSSFSSLDPSQFDPKLIESIIEIARMVTGKTAEKK
jgi:hypothetical protein